MGCKCYLSHVLAIKVKLIFDIFVSTTTLLDVKVELKKRMHFFKPCIEINRNICIGNYQQMKIAAVVRSSVLSGFRSNRFVSTSYAFVINVLVIGYLSAILSVTHAQDIWLQNYFSPVSECNASNSEIVNVLINNNSAVFIPANTISVHYSLDGSAPVTELLSSFLAPGASWNFSFSTVADLSACGSHSMRVWVQHAGDLNQMNDTLTWFVQNDCPIVPGTVSTDVTVCQGANAGMLNLTGWSNGSIANWEFSTNAGASWTPIANTTVTQNYVNIATETLYRVQINGGLCPNSTSGSATVSVQAPPIAGTVDGDMTLCETAGNGTLDLIGTVGAVNFWEYSDNSGVSWTNEANTTTSLTFSGLTTEHWYRALIEGGVCPDVWTDTAVISIDAVSNPGVMAADQSVCEGTAVNLSIAGNNGQVIDWEYSEDLIAWMPIGVTTGTYTTPNLTTTTHYRAVVQNGVCASGQTNTVTISVFPEPLGGQFDVDTTQCRAAANGTLILNGFAGTIVEWEQSDDFGASWNSIANTTSTYNYAGLTDTTWFRVIVDGGPCGMVYSDTAVVNIVGDSYGGVLSLDTTLCEGDFADLTLSMEVGSTTVWEESTDQVSWTPFATNQSVLTVSPPVTTYYQVSVQNLDCPASMSNMVTITVFPLPAVDAGFDVLITEGDTTQLNGSGGIAGVWTPPYNMDDQNVPDALCWPLQTTMYTYSVISSDGCLNHDSVTVTVESEFVPSFDIKNVITANQDGYNDFWIIEGIEDYPFTEVAVFNIYGVEVFSSEDYRNDWAGTSKGKRLPDGTYYYRVFIDGEEWKGNLTILGNE